MCLSKRNKSVNQNPHKKVIFLQPSINILPCSGVIMRIQTGYFVLPYTRLMGRLGTISDEYKWYNVTLESKTCNKLFEIFSEFEKHLGTTIVKCGGCCEIKD